jgi:hypothetical protein
MVPAVSSNVAFAFAFQDAAFLRSGIGSQGTPTFVSKVRADEFDVGVASQKNAFFTNEIPLVPNAATRSLVTSRMNNGPVYTAELDVGSVPSVVYRIVAVGSAQ